MIEAMNKAVELGAALTVEERNLLSVAYKNTIGSRRTAWRALSSIEKKEEQKGSKNLPLLKGYKMKGDYYRYISEYTSGSAHDDAGNKAHEAYKAATTVAEEELKTTHPVRLGLALNYSVFHYEVKNDPDAIADIDQIEENQYKDATTIMQLIRDNLTLWTSEMEEGDE
ncbi:UNVERIFIED_CONTAM: hypothetical protein GTU68_037039 [Idotea baltica]|nr:hypothetical protein [Idotea baltica]